MNQSRHSLEGIPDIMRARTGLILSLFATLAVSGCSETRVQNLLGSNKASSDEEQVPQGQALSMPPDLELRPPAGGGSEETNVADNTAQRAPSTAPADMDSVSPSEPEQDVAMNPPVDQQQAANQPAQTTQPPVQAAPRQPAEDVYVHFGISKTDADGKPKSDAQLYRELHAAKIAEKRKTNPKYGTIWNLGNVFSDD
ncbi:hypothetical protein BH10PSE7_BH10PSE7_07840 [soil metagenome]